MNEFKSTHSFCSFCGGEEFASIQITNGKQSPSTTPSPCSEWEDKLASTNPDDLPYHERIELEKHLEVCTSCAAIRRQDHILDHMIRRLPFEGLSPSEQDLPFPPRLKRLWEATEMQKNLTPEIVEKLVSEAELAGDVLEGPSTKGVKSPQSEELETTINDVRTRVVKFFIVVSIIVASTSLLSLIMLASTTMSSKGQTPEIFAIVVGVIGAVLYLTIVTWRAISCRRKNFKKGEILLPSQTRPFRKRRLHQGFKELVLF